MPGNVHNIYDAEVTVSVNAKSLNKNLGSVRGKLKAFSKNAKLNLGIGTPKEGIKNIEKDIQAAEKEMARLEKQYEAIVKSNKKSTAFKSLQEDAKRLESVIARTKEEINFAAGKGQTSTVEFLQKQLEKYEGQLRKTRHLLETGIDSKIWPKETAELEGLDHKLLEVESRLGQLRAQHDALGARERIFKRLSSGAGKFASIVRVGAAGVKALGGALKTLGSKILGRVNKALNKMKRGLKMGTGIKGLVRLGLAGAAVYLMLRSLREGFENLSKYSGEVGGSLTTLKNSLAMLKNALATAFAPIFTAIAPAINSLINMITRVATAIAHFTAAFTGKSTVVVAKPYNAVSSAADDAAGATDAANDAAKAYEKTLLGFDQINKLDDPSSKTGGASGAGASGAGASAGDMFETVEVDNGMENLVERIKRSFAEGDFTDLGRELGDKIAGALEGIPWDKIKAIAGRVGSSLATGFNGLNESGFWNSIGKTISEGLNSALEFLYQFVSKFKFATLGEAIGGGINTAVSTFEWAKLGTTIYKAIKGALTAIGSLFTTVDFEALGKSVVTTIANINWLDLFTTALKTAGSIVGGILSFLKGAWEQAISSMKTWITSGQIWTDLGNLGGAIGELALDLKGAAWEALKSVLDCILEILRAIFSRNAPETDATQNDQSSSAGGGKDFNLNYQGPQQEINVTANVTKTKFGALTDLQKTFSTTAKATKTTYKNLTTNQKSMPVTAKSTKTTFGSLTTAQKTFNATAKATGLTNAIPYGSRVISGLTAKVEKIEFMGSAVNQLKVAFSKKASGGLYSNSRWKPITTAASGGYFGQGQIFLAREAGPELVGRIGGGTGVMNNDQIVASVSAGVYKAVREAMSGNEGQQVVIIAPDGNELFKLMKSEAQAYTNSTGLAPFPV